MSEEHLQKVLALASAATVGLSFLGLGPPVNKHYVTRLELFLIFEQACNSILVSLRCAFLLVAIFMVLDLALDLRQWLRIGVLFL